MFSILIKRKVVFLYLLGIFCTGRAALAERYNKIVLVVPDSPSPAERNIMDLLQSRVSEKSPVRFATINASGSRLAGEDVPGTLVLFTGVASGNPALNLLLADRRIAPVNDLNPGPEGFLLKTETGAPGKGGRGMMAGVDNRGLLYAVGAFLRSCHFLADAIELEAFQLRTAPAFEVRGTQYGQSHVALNKAKVRPWIKEDKERAILDLALAGANTFFVEKRACPGSGRFCFSQIL